MKIDKLIPNPAMLLWLLEIGVKETAKIFSNTFCDKTDINELEKLICKREELMEYMGIEDPAKESVEIVKSYIKDKKFEQEMKKEAIRIAIEEANKERGLK